MEGREINNQGLGEMPMVCNDVEMMPNLKFVTEKNGSDVFFPGAVFDQGEREAGGGG